jgi:hypothetical protein
VASDHGEVFEPGAGHVREVRRETLPWVAAVPLFVKAPGHGRAGVSDRPVELVDVLPTVADVVGAKSPWRTDGSSVFDERRRRERKVIYGFGNRHRLHFSSAGREKFELLAEKNAVFKDGPFRAAPNGYRELIDRPVRSLRRGATTPVRADLENPSLWRDVDPRGPTIPACVSGRLVAAPEGGADLAVAVNGRVRAVTATYDEGRFAAMIPPDGFRRGANEVTLWTVDRGRQHSIREIPTG